LVLGLVKILYYNKCIKKLMISLPLKESKTKEKNETSRAKGYL
jgi:hypothetical protein